MPIYDDSRYTYDDPRITYDGTYLAPALTGAQPSGSGALTTKRTYRVALAGAQPAGSATLSQQVVYTRTLTGDQPAGSGLVNVRSFAIAALAGTQPPPSGELAGKALHHVLLEASQPEASGGIALARTVYRRTLVGFQAPASGIIPTYKASYKRTLAGSQDFPTGYLAPRPFRIYRVHLEGFQPVSISIRYEEPGITYEHPGVTYEDRTPGQLFWWVLHKRLLEGMQPPSEGTVDWAWNPYVWAQYHLSITDRPESVQYQFDLDADDFTITYDVDDAVLQDPVVYRVGAVTVYTNPPVGVRQKA